MAKKKCSDLAIMLYDAARAQVKLGATSIDEVVDNLQIALPGIDRSRLVSSILEVTEANKRGMTEFQKRLSRLKREAKRDKELQDTIADLENHISQGTVPVGKPPKAINRTEAIQQLTDKKNALLNQLRKSAPSLKAKYEKQINDSYAKLVDTNFKLPEVKREEFEENEELESLRFKRDQVREAARQKIENLKPKNFWDKSLDWANVPKSLMSSGELSTVLRQGRFAIFADPMAGTKAFGDMLKAFASEEHAARLNRKFLEDPDVQKLVRGGLALSDINGEMNQLEESMMSRTVNKLPGYRNFARGGNMFLNSLRVHGAKGLMQFTRGENPTMQEAKDIANAINVFTGRGSLGPFEKHAAALNAGMFSPRYQMSRLQMLTGQPLWGAKSPEIRKAIATRLYGRTLAGLASQYALYAMMFGDEEDFSVTFNPFSSDFGKIVVGQTRLDPLAGLSQMTTFLARAGAGAAKSLTSGYIDLGADKYGGEDVVANFGRSKASPPIGTAWDLIKGKDIMGNPTSLGGELLGLVAPMTYGDVYNNLTTEQGIDSKTAQSILAFFGDGLQVYEKKKPKKPLL